MQNLEANLQWLRREADKRIEQFFLRPSEKNKRALQEIQGRLNSLRREVGRKALSIFVVLMIFYGTGIELLWSASVSIN